MKKVFFVIVMVLAMVGCGATGDKIIYENYLKIRSGMTRSQVEEILGGSGKIVGQMGNYYTLEYTSKTFPVITVSFENGRSYAKAQTGL